MAAVSSIKLMVFFVCYFTTVDTLLPSCFFSLVQLRHRVGVLNEHVPVFGVSILQTKYCSCDSGYVIRPTHSSSSFSTCTFDFDLHPTSSTLPSSLHPSPAFESTSAPGLPSFQCDVFHSQLFSPNVVASLSVPMPLICLNGV